MTLPFKEEKISENTFIRTFYQDIESGELQWHRDYEDRIIEPIEETDWKFQLDRGIDRDFEFPMKLQRIIIITFNL
jgi:hypothetical protein